MDKLELLGPVAIRLHNDLVGVFYLMLPIFFALSLVFAWARSPAGGPDFLDSLKRLCVATLLLVAFPEISDAILAVSNGLASKISDMSGLENIRVWTAEKLKTYPISPMAAIYGFNDLLVSTLAYLSYLLLYASRYLMVALYHFAWCFLLITSPLILLFHLFSSSMTLNLFRSLVEVASWNIVWSILSAMLVALPTGNFAVADGDVVTVIIMNLTISLCMLGTPLVVKAIVGHGVAAMAGNLGPAIVTAMAILPAKAAASVKMGREMLTDTAGYIQSKRPKPLNIRSHDLENHMNSAPPRTPRPPKM